MSRRLYLLLLFPMITISCTTSTTDPADAFSEDGQSVSLSDASAELPPSGDTLVSLESVYGTMSITGTTSEIDRMSIDRGENGVDDGNIDLLFDDDEQLIWMGIFASDGGRTDFNFTYNADGTLNYTVIVDGTQLYGQQNVIVEKFELSTRVMRLPYGSLDEIAECMDTRMNDHINRACGGSAINSEFGKALRADADFRNWAEGFCLFGSLTLARVKELDELCNGVTGDPNIDALFAESIERCRERTLKIFLALNRVAGSLYTLGEDLVAKKLEESAASAGKSTAELCDEEDDASDGSTGGGDDGSSDGGTEPGECESITGHYDFDNANSVTVTPMEIVMGADGIAATATDFISNEFGSAPLNVLEGTLATGTSGCSECISFTGSWSNFAASIVEELEEQSGGPPASSYVRTFDITFQPDFKSFSGTLTTTGPNGVENAAVSGTRTDCN